LITAARFSAAQIWKTEEKQDNVKRAQPPRMIAAPRKRNGKWFEAKGSGFRDNNCS